jgi:hypothetical protein
VEKVFSIKKQSLQMQGRTKKNHMKNLPVIISVALMATAFYACQPMTSEAEKDAIDVTTYVDSIQNLTPVYTNNYWAILDKEYQMRIEKAQSNMEALDEEALQALEESKAKYEALKASYTENILAAEAAAATNYRSVLRNRLFGEGMIGDDMGFAFANANNLHDIYQKFVNTVDANKKDYSREDWDEIKVLYEALDTRKNTVEKDLPKGDNLKIAGLKIKFAAIKATNRGGTKGAENQAAKDKS